MRLILFILLFPVILQGQELFSYTESASNMAARSIGIRINQELNKKYNGDNEYKLNPEVMFGVSKKIMLHTEAFFSQRARSLTSLNRQFGYDGVSLYGKYRFYSVDEVHSHFRMAVFARVAGSNTHIHEPAIDLQGDNTGVETGLVATKLINKIAVSASGSFLHAADNGSKKFLYGNKSRNAIGYSFSVGKLMLPKEYTDYKQTNLNLMVEFLGQYNPGIGDSYLDIAPSLQLIFLSKMRLDLGYSFPLVNYLVRTVEKGFLLRLEYNIFNAY